MKSGAAEQLLVSDPPAFGAGKLDAAVAQELAVTAHLLEAVEGQRPIDRISSFRGSEQRLGDFFVQFGDFFIRSEFEECLNDSRLVFVRRSSKQDSHGDSPRRMLTSTPIRQTSTQSGVNAAARSVARRAAPVAAAGALRKRNRDVSIGDICPD